MFKCSALQLLSPVQIFGSWHFSCSYQPWQCCLLPHLSFQISLEAHISILYSFTPKVQVTLCCQKYSLICLYTHMNLSDIPLLIHRVWYDVGPPFEAITALTLLGKLSQKSLVVCLWEILTILSEAHLWGQTLMLDEKAWLAVSALIHPKGVLSGWGQVSVQASQVLPHQTRSSISLWTLLCAPVRSHVGTGRGHGCSCSVLETHSMKVSTHCSWVNLKATLSLEVYSDWSWRPLRTMSSASSDPALLFYVAYHFVAELLLIPIASTLL